MRTSEERVKELHQRMDALKNQRNIRKYRVQNIATFAACLGITIAIAYVIAGTAIQNPAYKLYGVSGSIFADNAALGYVVIALLAFCLGALATIFCFRLRKHMEEKNNDRRP